MNAISTIRKPSRLTVYATLYIAFLYLPVLMIPLFSLNDSIYVSFPLKGFTTQWYASLWGNDGIRDAFFNSLRVGLSAAVVSTAGGTMSAYAFARRPNPAARTITSTALIPMAVPGIVTGVAVLIVVNMITIGPSLIAVTLGHICICLPLVIVIMKGRFLSYSKSIEEAAFDLGANEWQTFLMVSLPLVAPGIASSFFLAFTTSFDEFIVSFFLTGTEPTLPIYIWSQLRFPSHLPQTLALGSVILLGSASLVLLAEWLRRQEPRRKMI
ncbi:spermidine/putrescine transport system permease protein [Paraburkholderia sp. GAS334]